MSGHAAMNGFNFQNAHAVFDLLNMQLNDDADHARLEGKDDALDFELYDNNGKLLVGKQLKTRVLKNAWSGNEILSEVERWHSIEYTTEKTCFEFVTNGRLGPSAQLVEQALGESSFIDLNLDDEITARIMSNREILRRTQIHQSTESIESLLGKCLVLAAKLQSDNSSESHAKSRSEFVVNELFKIVSIKSGEGDAEKRTISSSEIRSLLDQPEAVALQSTWNDDVFGKAIEQLELKLEVPPQLQLQLENDLSQSCESASEEPEAFLAMLKPNVVGIIHGPSGYGKTEFLNTLASSSLNHSKLLLRVDAYAYTRGRLTQLIANALNAIHFSGAFPATGNKILQDPRVIIALDNASELTRDSLHDLQHEVREYFSMNTRCSLILVGRKQVTLKGLLPQNIKIVSASLAELNIDKQIELLNHWGVNTRHLNVGNLISKGGPGNRTPLFLWISSQAALNGTLMATPAGNYENFVIQKCESVGLEGSTLLLAAASCFIANSSPSDRKSISSLDFQAISRVICEKFEIDRHSFEQFFFETGLFVRSTGDRISPFHDSFTDFLLAKAASLNQIKAENIEDYEHLVHEFLIQLRVSNHKKIESLAINAPFVLPRMARWEKLPNNEINIDFVCSLLAEILPIGTNLKRHSVAGFIEIHFHEPLMESSPKNAFAASPIVVSVGNGEIDLATRIWQLYLRNKLDIRRERYTRRPTTNSEYKVQLVEFAEQLSSDVEALLTTLVPSKMKVDIMGHIPPYQYQFCFPSQSNEKQMLDSIDFLISTDKPTTRLIPEEQYSKMCAEARVTWGQALNDSFSKQAAPAMAADIMLKAINQLVGFKWI